MAKPKPKNSSIDPKTIDIVALIVAIIFMQTTLTTFHHVAINRHIGPPSWLLLCAAVLLTAYSSQKQKKLSTIGVIVLTVLAVSSLFWLSGLRANFF